jgi:hypothetical protein
MGFNMYNFLQQLRRFMAKSLLNKKLRSFVAVAALMSGAVYVAPSFAQSADCTTYPQLSLSENVSTTSEHAIWVLAKKESNEAVPYIRINNGECIRLEVPESNDWEWVSGESGVLRRELWEGENNFDLSVSNGAILIDKILATNDTDCRPVGMG